MHSDGHSLGVVAITISERETHQYRCQGLQKALERKDVRPIEAELSVPEGVEIIGGKRWQELGQLEGRSNKIWNWWGSASPTDNRCKLEWVVRGPASARLNLAVRAQRAGTLRKEIVLDAG